MKRFFVLAACMLLAGASSSQELLHCGADEIRISTLKQNPAIAKAVAEREVKLESFTEQFVGDFYSNGRSSATYVIPTVFHVIHNYGSENISDAQILDGLNILNLTFRKLLPDTASIVAAFKPIHADCDIEFRLATLDPSGNCTSGINRIVSTLTTVGDHSVKSLIQWPTDKYLNVYIVANAAGLAGHCVWPSDADTIPQWDGIVIGHNYVGTIGTSNYTQSVAFAHECGHYLNLHHIWGGNNVPGFYYLPCADPSNCGSTDFVGDTPPTIGWQSCNLSAASCGNPVDNVQNTMDYSYCNRMFTYGQKARMQACLNSSTAGRNNLWQPANLAATGTLTFPAPLCKADFTADKRVVCQTSPNTIVFSNTSYHGTISTVAWQFPGGSPSTSSASSPSVIYSTPGKHDVTLTISDGTSTVTETKYDFITVLPSSGPAPPFSEGFESLSDFSGPDWFSNSFDTLNEWQLSNVAASGGTRSAMLDNHSHSGGSKDELISKVINLSGSSSMNLSFKYAYAKKDSADNDKLQLHISNNCNSTWLQRMLINGTTLETASPTSSPFIPSASEWKQAATTIPGPYLASSFRFKFTFTCYGGNNFYIDDINLDVMAGEEEFFSQLASLNIFPNPAANSANILFSLDNTMSLRIRLLNVLGKEVYTGKLQLYPAGRHELSLPLEGLASGVYIVKIENGNHSITRKLTVNPY
jgi:PKD repeat protein